MHPDKRHPFAKPYSASSKDDNICSAPRPAARREPAKPGPLDASQTSPPVPISVMGITAFGAVGGLLPPRGLLGNGHYRVRRRGGMPLPRSLLGNGHYRVWRRGAGCRLRGAYSVMGITVFGAWGMPLPRTCSVMIITVAEPWGDAAATAQLGNGHCRVRRRGADAASVGCSITGITVFGAVGGCRFRGACSVMGITVFGFARYAPAGGCGWLRMGWVD